MKSIWSDSPRPQTPENKRAAERQALRLPARLTWKDQRGTTRFASVVTRDVSDFGVFVESPSMMSIPLYRLVQFQLETNVRETEALPSALRSGRVLSAVYRVSPPTSGGGRQGFALRLMVDPRRRHSTHSASPAPLEGRPATEATQTRASA